MTVQGMMLANGLQENYGADILLNETHPKVLYHALRKADRKQPDTYPVPVPTGCKTKDGKQKLRKYDWNTDVTHRMKAQLADWISSHETRLTLSKEQRKSIDQIDSSDRWDALISAWATYMGSNDKWDSGCDLMGSTGALVSWPLRGRIHYYWPKKIEPCKGTPVRLGYTVQPGCCSRAACIHPSDAH